MIIGLGKCEITPELTNTSMLGYGNLNQVARSIENPIYARTFLIETSNSYFVIINLEICFITELLKQKVLSRLSKLEGLEEVKSESIIVTAQHTHSAPGGIDEYALYNMTTPGYVNPVVEAYVNGAVESVQIAFKNKESSDLFYAKDHFSPTLPVAFNRSLMAYLENPEVKEHSLPTDKHLALDRAMKSLFIKRSGKFIGCVNWFGVHGTSLPNDNGIISGDNKGVAAQEMENHFESDFTALFNQGNAGDVSPNWIWDENLKRTRGVAQDSFKNAQTNGKLQSSKAIEILDNIKSDNPISNHLDSILVYQDMGNIDIDSQFLADGEFRAKSSHACLGVSFLEGTKEGPGIPISIGLILKLTATLNKAKNIIYSLMLPLEGRIKIWDFYRSQGNKDIFIDAHLKKVLGVRNLLLLPIPEVINPAIRVFKSYFKVGALEENTWVQEILPIQLNRVGEILFCSIPAELTTMAGRRIEEQLKDDFKDDGVNEIILCPYSNSYCGYITTPEEYEVQLYEGGHTLFGKWTLPAFQTVIKKLSIEFKKDKSKRDLSWGVQPPTFTKEELTKRSTHSN